MVSVAGTPTAAALVGAAVGRRFTAAVLRIERAGRCVFERAYGALDDTPGAAATTLTTPFDLASLTKPVVATAALVHLAAPAALGLDAPLARVLPEWRDREHASVTLRRLLAHTGGLQSGADYRTLFAEQVETYALRRPLVAPPGERVIYSDLGFIALGVALARAIGTSLARAVAEALAWCGARETRYRPRGERACDVPATELDGWRGRVRGAVHDEKAALMGGVAGHAGLFGTAADVAAVADRYLAVASGRAALGPYDDLLQAAVTEQAFDPVLRRGLGWALKTSDENSCGARMARATFGHTGFTGTCVWADPTRDLSVVLLTNAVYYGRRDLRDLRAAVCDAAVVEFGA